MYLLERSWRVSICIEPSFCHLCQKDNGLQLTGICWWWNVLPIYSFRWAQSFYNL